VHRFRKQQKLRTFNSRVTIKYKINMRDSRLRDLRKDCVTQNTCLLFKPHNELFPFIVALYKITFLVLRKCLDLLEPQSKITQLADLSLLSKLSRDTNGHLVRHVRCLLWLPRFQSPVTTT
jgi:hypothetical protein